MHTMGQKMPTPEPANPIYTHGNISWLHSSLLQCHEGNRITHIISSYLRPRYIQSLHRLRLAYSILSHAPIDHRRQACSRRHHKRKAFRRPIVCHWSWHHPRLPQCGESFGTSVTNSRRWDIVAIRNTLNVIERQRQHFCHLQRRLLELHDMGL